MQVQRGLGRHVVRFVRYEGGLYALKELPSRLAEREQQLLGGMAEAAVPAVEIVGVVDDRGPDLDAVLITRHLEYSIPYRFLFARRGIELHPALLRALADLLVRLHVAGFFWGDCSLSNALFRRDAGAFSAYVVDAETGERHPTLTDGQRSHDLTLAEENVAGELLDVAAEVGGPDLPDPGATADALRAAYEAQWAAAGSGPDASRRRLHVLTGLWAQENQARRMLDDIAAFRGAAGDVSESVAAARWRDEVFEPAVAAVPDELWGKRPAAEVFHELLEHRWFLSERAGRDVGMEAAARSYVEEVLPNATEERTIL